MGVIAIPLVLTIFFFFPLQNTACVGAQLNLSLSGQQQQQQQAVWALYNGGGAYFIHRDRPGEAYIVSEEARIHGARELEAPV